jgi:hypothetical protein
MGHRGDNGMLGFVRGLSVGLLIVAVAFVGANTLPTALPEAHGEQISVAGAILGLAIIAGIIYLVTRDRYGVYHRYPYGRYYSSGPHYRYQGPYSVHYRPYQNRFYRGPLPGRWRGDHGCVGTPPWPAQCY